MGNILVSIRLPSRLATAVDRAAEALELSPSQLVERLLHMSGPYERELLKVPLEGPFPVKINLRLSPEGMNKLRQLTAYKEIRSGEFAYGIQTSIYLRSLLAYFFSRPDAFRAAFPNAPKAEDWSRLSEDKEEGTMRRVRPFRRAPRPGDPRVGLLIVFLPLLVVAIFGIIDLFKRPDGREPPPPSPSSGGGRKLAGDTDERVDQSFEEAK